MPAKSPKPRRPAPAGTALRASGKDGPQRIESKGARWTDAAEQVFEDHLAASCNVTYAARMTGFTKTAVYQHRRTDPAFAARWAAALEQGYVRIEFMLVQRALKVLEGRVPDPDTPFADMTVRDAIAILQLHRANVKGGGRAPGWRARPRSLEQMRASILKKFEAVEAHRKASAAPQAKAKRAPKA